MEKKSENGIRKEKILWKEVHKRVLILGQALCDCTKVFSTQ